MISSDKRRKKTLQLRFFYNRYRIWRGETCFSNFDKKAAHTNQKNAPDGGRGGVDMREWLAETGAELSAVLRTSTLGILRLAAVAFFGFLAVRLLLLAFRKLMGKTSLRGAAGDFLASLLKVLLLVVYAVILLSMLGVDTTSLVAIFTALSLAISLAVQGTVSNVASGILLISAKHFEEGDFVEIDGTAGTVETITISCTKLRTPDHKVIVIPNSTVTGSNIVNYSAKRTRRLDLTLFVAYGSDVEQVKAVALAAIGAHPRVLHDPAPFVRLLETGESALRFTARVWVRTDDYWDVYYDLGEQLLAALSENGFQIPFRQLTVHVAQQEGKQ